MIIRQEQHDRIHIYSLQSILDYGLSDFDWIDGHSDSLFHLLLALEFRHVQFVEAGLSKESSVIVSFDYS